MKNIRFQQMSLLSFREKKARVLNLDSDVIYITGHANKIGKSCILKSIYRGLGGKIRKISDDWLKANVIIILHFSIDGVRFKSLRIGNELIIFNPDNSKRFKLLLNNRNDYRQLCSFFGIIDNPILSFVTAGTILMPFYIDQDSGWNDSWSSFTDIGNAKEKKIIQQYFTGIIDDEYLIKKNKYVKICSGLDKVLCRLKEFRRMHGDAKYRYKELDIAISIDEFKERIDTYLSKLQYLREQQNSLIREQQDLYVQKASLELNIKQLEKNISEIEKDFHYAMNLDSIIVCPTCGCLYDNNMSNRYEINKDIYECKDLILSYKQDLDEVNERISRTSNRVESINNEMLSIQMSIQENNNSISLEELIEDLSRKKLLDIIEEREYECKKTYTELSLEKKELENSFKEINKSVRKAIVEKKFKDGVLSSLKKMGVYVNKDDVRFGGKIVAMGSNLPQYIVAYLFAYYLVMVKYGSPVFFPIVIDEPQQQGLSDDGLQKLVDFMLENMPEDSQLILSSANEKLSVDGAFIIDLGNDNNILIEDDFQVVNDELSFLLERDYFT